MRTVQRLALVALPALAALSCSPANLGSPPDAAVESAAPVDSGADTGDAGSSAEQLCKNYAYARCTRLQTCSPTEILLAYGNVATCESLYAATCTLSQAAPSTGSTPAGVQGCITALPTWGCTDLIFSENAPPACATPQGSLANGAPCGVNAQCQSTWCSRLPGSACGTCGPLPQPGTPCETTAECGSGLTCVGSTKKCATHAPLGAACSSTQPCNDGLACAPSGSGNVCQQTATAGACSPAPGCNEYMGLACNAATGMCQTLQVVMAGQPCGTVADQRQDCQAGTCTHGACVANSPPDAPCDLAAGPSCMSFGVCVVTSDGGTSGTCQLAGSGCF